MEIMTVIKTTSRANGGIEKYKKANPYPFLNSILMDVCYRTGISLRLIKSKLRWREVVDARSIYYLRAKKLTKCTLQTIGEAVKRDHATVLHGLVEANRVKEIQELYNKLYETEKT